MFYLREVYNSKGTKKRTIKMILILLFELLYLLATGGKMCYDMKNLFPGGRI